MSLDGPWRFQIGDDPRWADPKFDDSAWQTVKLGNRWQSRESTPTPGTPGTGCVSNRSNSPSSISPGNPQLDLLVTGDSIGQLAAYVNGLEAGHTQRHDRSAVDVSIAAVRCASFRPQADGTIVLAIQTWAGPGVSIAAVFCARWNSGDEDDIADRLAHSIDRLWDQHFLAGSRVSFLFLCVARWA